MYKKCITETGNLIHTFLFICAIHYELCTMNYELFHVFPAVFNIDMPWCWMLYHTSTEVVDAVVIYTTGSGIEFQDAAIVFHRLALKVLGRDDRSVRHGA